MGAFKFTAAPLDGVVIIEPECYTDDRGFFMESYSARDFAKVGITAPFVQDNHSRSRRGVLRGMHFQAGSPQGKLVRVVKGHVLDVAVNIRPGSPTFGKWTSVELSGENMRQIYIPPGFAHGFLATVDDTHLIYKCTDYYAPGSERGIIWNDPAIGIDWQLDKFGIAPEDLILSAKDLALLQLSDAL